jgi:DNA-binding beta-propeller fold protein YncE
MFSFGKKGAGDGQFQKPYDIAINQNMIFVTDPKNKRIQVFDLDGNFISKFSPSHDNLRNPSEITVSEDRIFLTDTKKAGIFVYDLDGNPITEFDSKGDGEKDESSNDLLTYGNHLLVVDGENNRIQVFDFEGNYIRMFGAFVPQNPNDPIVKKEAPHSIAYSNNKFYVGHTGSFNVKTYDAYGTNSIPTWIKNNAGWWANGQIPDSTFIDGIEFLIKDGIIVVSDTQQNESETDGIPEWVKNNAGWWADGQIPDSAFIDGIEFLIKDGILKIN